MGHCCDIYQWVFNERKVVLTLKRKSLFFVKMDIPIYENKVILYLISIFEYKPVYSITWRHLVTLLEWITEQETQQAILDVKTYSILNKGINSMKCLEMDILFSSTALCSKFVCIWHPRCSKYFAWRNYIISKLSFFC